MTQSPDSAAASLAALQASRERLADAAVCPPGRHAVFALLVGTYVAAPAAGLYGSFVVLAAVAAAAGLLVWRDKRRDGLFVSGWLPGDTIGITFAVVAGMIVLFLVGTYIVQVRGLAWPPVALAVPAALAGAAGSVRWQRVYRRGLGAR